MRRILSILAFVAATIPAAGAGMPPVQQVSARMAESRALSISRIRNYTVLRRYTLTAGHGQHSAEMLVRVNYIWPGQKKFEIVSESGSSTILKKVFHRLLKAEEDASRHDVRLSPENYNFQPEGADTVDGRPCFILRLTPKTSGKYLIRGRVWVDAADFAAVRVEGEPVDSGSFWINSTHIVQKYGKVGGFWMPADSESDSEVKIFGRAHLRIQSLDYKINQWETADQADLLVRPPVE
jgi:hypothetical protein